jgi:hypothetical protein
MLKRSIDLVYECGLCSHRSHFFANEISEALITSWKGIVYLSDSALEEHLVVFFKGYLYQVLCPINENPVVIIKVDLRG